MGTYQEMRELWKGQDLALGGGVCVYVCISADVSWDTIQDPTLHVDELCF